MGPSMVQHGHGDGCHHGDLLAIILEDEDHVEVFHAEGDSLEVAELHVLQGDDEWRPCCQVDKTGGGGLQ